MTRRHLNGLGRDLHLLAFLFGFQLAVVLRAQRRVALAQEGARATANAAIEVEDRVDALLARVDDLQEALAHAHADSIAPA